MGRDEEQGHILWHECNGELGDYVQVKHPFDHYINVKVKKGRKIISMSKTDIQGIESLIREVHACLLVVEKV